MALGADVADNRLRPSLRPAQSQSSQGMTRTRRLAAAPRIFCARMRHKDATQPSVPRAGVSIGDDFAAVCRFLGRSLPPPDPPAKDRHWSAYEGRRDEKALEAQSMNKIT